MTGDVIRAGWAAKLHIQALTTTRTSGSSVGPFESFNLAAHVGDDETAVQDNRDQARRRFGLPGDPVWLQQVHGANIVRADIYHAGRGADGSFTETPGIVCAIMTADCLPLFLCDVDGSKVGLFHIGWRGLAQGMVRKAARLFTRGGGGRALAWFGPAIGPQAFEVGGDVKSTLESATASPAGCFRRTVNGKWLVDLYALTAGELELEGIECSYDHSLCTFNDRARFYSHRRCQPCGRMASIIWMNP